MTNIEAGCYKCHNASPEVPGAAALNNGRDLIRIYGCFGCHKIPGYENIRKVGPDLSTVSGKLTEGLGARSGSRIRRNSSPKRACRKFWCNSNNSGVINGVDWDKRNVAEINAITEYLWSKSTAEDAAGARTPAEMRHAARNSSKPSDASAAMRSARSRKRRTEPRPGAGTATTWQARAAKSAPTGSTTG